MAEMENSRDLKQCVMEWGGCFAFKKWMLMSIKIICWGLFFYKYLSDSFLIKVYDMICDGKPESLKEALDAYVKVLNGEDGEALKTEMKCVCHYVIEPELTYTILRMQLEIILLAVSSYRRHLIILSKVMNCSWICFTDIDLYSNRLGVGDQKQVIRLQV